MDISERISELADIYVEYVIALKNIEMRKDDICDVVNKIIDSGINIASISSNFCYKEKYGLVYKAKQTSSYLAVQKIDTSNIPSFSKILVFLEQEDISPYMKQKEFLSILRDEANSFTKDFDELKKQSI